MPQRPARVLAPRHSGGDRAAAPAVPTNRGPTRSPRSASVRATRKTAA